MTKQMINPYARLNLRKQIYMECRAMAEYALARGKLVPAEAIKSIEVFEAYSSFNDEEPPESLKEIDIADLVETHYLLVRLIDPATPQTVLLLDVEQETDGVFKLLGPVALVRQLMLTAIISLFIFIGLIASPYINEATLTGNVLSAHGISQLSCLVFYMSAAGLGGSFAALYKANDYISKGTYDPCYQSSYWIRLSLGIIAGLLLAVLISEKSLEGEGMLSTGVIRPLLGILGGFSADLLYTFLSKMVETFKSLFEGNSQNIIDAKAQEGRARLASLEVDRRMKLAESIIQMQQQVDGETSPEAVKQQMKEILQGLMKA